MMEEDNMTFNIIRNYPTERRYLMLKEISNSFMDNLRRILGK